jgi:hypothetical protein
MQYIFFFFVVDIIGVIIDSIACVVFDIYLVIKEIKQNKKDEQHWLNNAKNINGDCQQSLTSVFLK